MIYIIISLSIILLLSLYTNYRALGRIELYEEKHDDLELFIIQLQEKSVEWISQIKAIDDKGTFESDDEVGHFFTELKDLFKRIRSFVDSEKIYGKKKEEQEILH